MRCPISVCTAAISRSRRHLCAIADDVRVAQQEYSAGLRRLGYGSAATLFFDEHVEADSVHEQIAVRDLAGGLVSDRPALLDDVLLGAAACLALDDLLGEHVPTAGRGAGARCGPEPLRTTCPV